jgi:hypothetical protein
MTPAGRGAEHSARLPPLEPVLVATDDEGVEQLMRSTRAELARLSLELRVAGYKADLEEQSQSAIDPASGGFDLSGARRLLQWSLTERLDARRLQLAQELDAARLEAARIVASAHRRADAYVTEAHEGVLGTLLRPGELLRPLPPLPPTVVPHESAPDLAVAPAVAAPLAPEATPMVAVAPAVAVPAPTPPPTATLPPRPADLDEPRPAWWSRLLYADVLLPLIAVCAVLVVLLAWVG